jgi:hypothetical protein
MLKGQEQETALRSWVCNAVFKAADEVPLFALGVDIVTNSGLITTDNGRKFVVSIVEIVE